jgi:acetyl-CoA synthetase
MDTIETLLSENRRFSASDDFKKNAAITDGGIYHAADQDRLAFWETKANDLTWFQKWHTVLNWNRPYAKWFVGGTLNASYNCLDVHLSTHRSSKPAIIWEGEEGDVKTYTYHQLHTEVCKLANVLTQKGIQKGDRVTLYMPMIPELAIGVLACARIGAIHSVVFGGFSANSLKDRLIDSGSRLILTANAGSRRGKQLPIKDIVDQAIAGGDTQVTSVIVVSHLKSYHATMSPIDHNYDDLMSNASTHHDAVAMDSEDPLFILYTSGTTGKPKGIVHTTGGYLTHAKYSTKAVFDINDGDIYWCTADIGWITGHTYVIYGPLSNGATCLMFEGTPDYPAQDRFWQLIDKHKVTILYTAPTAIRSFMKWGNHLPAQYQLSSLRLLGSVGEPINPEAWMWYYTHIGHQKCPIVDTWWQTETGGIMISNLPALNDMKPGYTGLPLPGIKIEILDTNGHPITKGGGLLSITHPWPSMLRGVWGDQKRYSDTYWSRFDTYFAGDGATIDDDGYVMVLGRVDDVLNVAGHRIGTMEVESALVDCPDVSEAAVVGMPDDIKGQAIVAFVIIEDGKAPSPQLERELISQVGDKIGAIAKPKRIIFTQELPKTRSGKIMRRLLKNIVEGQPLGDATTLANPDAVVLIQQAFNNPV